MAIKISPEAMKQIELTEYGLSGDIGGLPRTTYYTPDGRVIRAVPCIRTNQAGQTRDANLDQGWLLSPPTTLKPYCGACDHWHDTPEQVKACITRQQQFVKQAARQTEQENTDKTAALEKEVAELKALVQKLVGGNGNVRQVFQREANEPSRETPPKAGS